MTEGSEASRAAAAARVLGDVLTAHYKEGSSWAALMEVDVETALVGGQELTSPANSGHIVTVVCAILIGLMTVVALLLFLLWRVRKRPSTNGRVEAGRCVPEMVEKSNNLQNEENLRRQISQMKTLNVMELKRVDELHKKLHDQELEESTKASSSRRVEESFPHSSSSGSGSSSSSSSSISSGIDPCMDLIESNPIYKAPCVDVRNTIVASNILSKDVHLKVLPLQRTSLRIRNDHPVKCQEVVV